MIAVVLDDRTNHTVTRAVGNLFRKNAGDTGEEYIPNMKFCMGFTSVFRDIWPHGHTSSNLHNADLCRQGATVKV